MKTALVALLAMTAGCTSAAGSGFHPSSLPSIQRPSWVRPDAKNKKLIYISSVYVYIVTSSDEIVGMLRGFAAGGLCSDQAGNVFVTDIDGSQIFEYPHAGTTPIGLLDDSGGTPGACAVDPTTGNLAVINKDEGSPGSTEGSVSIYAKAQGSAQLYSDARVYHYGFCSYDSKGNLFVSGSDADGAPRFVELPQGKKTFKNITLGKRAHVGNDRIGAVQWDGQYIALADISKNVIYRIAVSGRRGKIVKTIHLQSWETHGPVQFWIQGNTIIQPVELEDYSVSMVGFWRYPAGGAPVNGLYGLSDPYGVTVSIAAHT